MALAETPEQFKAVSAVFDELTQRKAVLEAEVAQGESEHSDSTDAESEIDAALQLAHRLTKLAGAAESLESCKELFDLVNMRLFLGFRPVKKKKRTVNKLRTGIITFGAAPPPISIYQGPTDRKKIQAQKQTRTKSSNGCSPAAEAARESDGPGGEGKSLGNVNRGDWI